MRAIAYETLIIPFWALRHLLSITVSQLAYLGPAVDIPWFAFIAIAMNTHILAACWNCL